MIYYEIRCENCWNKQNYSVESIICQRCKGFGDLELDSIITLKLLDVLE